jgi:small-conductance mechanosensitive channel
MQGQKLPYEVGDVVKISNVKGMISKTDMTASIN